MTIHFSSSSVPPVSQELLFYFIPIDPRREGYSFIVERLFLISVNDFRISLGFSNSSLISQIFSPSLHCNGLLEALITCVARSAMVLSSTGCRPAFYTVSLIQNPFQLSFRKQHTNTTNNYSGTHGQKHKECM